MRVLLVEDDTATIEAIRLCIERYYPEATTISTSHGLKAVEMLKTDKFDIALVDLGLPDIDGLEMIKAIRRLSNVPIMVISARYSDQWMKEASAMGASDYIAKPFDFHQLTERLAVITSR